MIHTSRTAGGSPCSIAPFPSMANSMQLMSLGPAYEPNDGNTDRHGKRDARSLYEPATNRWGEGRRGSREKRGNSLLNYRPSRTEASTARNEFSGRLRSGGSSIRGGRNHNGRRGGNMFREPQSVSAVSHRREDKRRSDSRAPPSLQARTYRDEVLSESPQSYHSRPATGNEARANEMTREVMRRLFNNRGHNQADAPAAGGPASTAGRLYAGRRYSHSLRQHHTEPDMHIPYGINSSHGPAYTHPPTHHSLHSGGRPPAGYLMGGRGDYGRQTPTDYAGSYRPVMASGGGPPGGYNPAMDGSLGGGRGHYSLDYSGWADGMRSAPPPKPCSREWCRTVFCCC
eukprot:GHVN01024944.1.p1 GENE.GHVN01024944.1~~GHVN01024944.1.p1  ORF type:complete len:343 (+),score=25.60 GHVN01024944.1:46-1074(+)